MDGFLLLTIRVDDLVVLSEIYEDETIETEIATIEEANIVLPTSFVELDQVLSIIMIKHHNTIIVGRTEIMGNAYICSIVAFLEMSTMTPGFRSLSSLTDASARVTLPMCSYFT